MYDTILVPTDGSDVARAAGEYGARLASVFDAALHVITVRPRSGRGGDDDPNEQQRGTEDVTAMAGERDVPTTTAAVDAETSIHREILRYAGDVDADLVVMGTRGRGTVGRFLIGSVALQTLRESPLPVVTVNDEVDVDRDLDRILVSTDGSPGASAAVDHAFELASAVDARVHVASVHERLVGLGDETETVEATRTIDVSQIDVESTEGPTGVEAVDDALMGANEAAITTVDVSILEGRASQSILAVAAESDADCLVVGTHGRSGLRRHLLGSTTDRVVRLARVPVIAVRPKPAEAISVEYLDYTVLEQRGWSLDDDDLFEIASEADLDAAAHGTLSVPADEYVLDAAEDAGLRWPAYCRAGGCVNCAAIVLEGDLEMDVQRSLSEEEVERMNLRLTCVGTPTGDRVRLVYNAKHLDELRDRVL